MKTFATTLALCAAVTANAALAFDGWNDRGPEVRFNPSQRSQPTTANVTYGGWNDRGPVVTFAPAERATSRVEADVAFGGWNDRSEQPYAGSKTNYGPVSNTLIGTLADDAAASSN